MGVSKEEVLEAIKIAYRVAGDRILHIAEDIFKE
jgi:hypothetical protein